MAPTWNFSFNFRMRAASLLATLRKILGRMLHDGFLLPASLPRALRPVGASRKADPLAA